MNRLVGRQRAALALFIAFSIGFIGVALATPQSADQPTVTVDLSPNDGANLADTASLQVSGVGFTPNTQVVLTEQAPLPSGLTASSDTLGTVTTDGAGNFSQTINVTRMFTDVSSGGGTVNCGAAGVQCFVDATAPSSGANSHHTISFGGVATTTTAAPTTTTTAAPTTTTTTAAPTTTTTTAAPTTTTTTAPPTTTTTAAPTTTTTAAPTTTTAAPTTTTTAAPTTTSTFPGTTIPVSTIPGGTTTTTTGGGPTTTTTTIPAGPTTTNPNAMTSTTFGTTTTVAPGGSPQCASLRAARASLNTQVTTIEAFLSQAVSSTQRAAIVAQLEAIRVQGNAQLDALLAGC